MVLIINKANDPDDGEGDPDDEGDDPDDDDDEVSSL